MRAGRRVLDAMWALYDHRYFEGLAHIFCSRVPTTDEREKLLVAAMQDASTEIRRSVSLERIHEAVKARAEAWMKKNRRQSGLFTVSFGMVRIANPKTGGLTFKRSQIQGAIRQAEKLSGEKAPGYVNVQPIYEPKPRRA